MDRCFSFTGHSFGKLRCFSIQKTSAKGFGSVGNRGLHSLKDWLVYCFWKIALRSPKPMILKIERIRDSHKGRLRLSGEFRSHHLDQVTAASSRGEPTR